jgi:hypothetical protein
MEIALLIFVVDINGMICLSYNWPIYKNKT